MKKKLLLGMLGMFVGVMAMQEEQRLSKRPPRTKIQIIKVGASEPEQTAAWKALKQFIKGGKLAFHSGGNLPTGGNLPSQSSQYETP